MTSNDAIERARYFSLLTADYPGSRDISNVANAVKTKISRQILTMCKCNVVEKLKVLGSIQPLPRSSIGKRYF